MVESLLALRVIPIFNENDAVSTRRAPYELQDSCGIFWDNDSLAGLLALELKANLLVLLSDVDCDSHGGCGDEKLERQGSAISEVELMKERFAKMLLGEGMSGCGNGVSTALAISNAITNLCATLFGQLWRLEPLPLEKKAMWRREMEWILSVSDHNCSYVRKQRPYDECQNWSEHLSLFDVATLNRLPSLRPSSS